ncbi:hypothetical protein SCOR_01265 [Sulfidibacter corallicola]|uniref:Uncharacterized protein n=1 Tax=Sulfidibacter corallicola TaxID=2818388 RepID=A0A8A4TI26_SULCO|nr:hypothetical protein [Sulfidibacter corallicola]QTD48844.1 hypothetical protein J3U87_24950 [Sulfidibacter corallicola]
MILETKSSTKMKARIGNMSKIPLSGILTWICAIMMVSQPSRIHAGIKMRQTVNPVFIAGSCEQNGIIFFSFEADDFSSASPETPIYLKFQLQKKARLCRTEVNQAEADRIGLDLAEVYLPLMLRYSGQSPEMTVAAPGDTLSVVRWVAGEDSIWFRVSHSSSTWLRIGDALKPPSPEHAVEMVLGVPASEGWERHHDAFADGLANLPFATRNLEVMEHDYPDAVSLMLCTNLSNSTLRALPEPQSVSGLNLNPTAWRGPLDELQTISSPATFPQGRVFPLQLSGWNGTPLPEGIFIGRGFSFDCDTHISNAEPVYVSTCSDDTPWVTAGGNFVAHSICGQGRGVHKYSRFRLRIPTTHDMGFQVSVDDQGEPLGAAHISGRAETVLLVAGAFSGQVDGNDLFSAPYTDTSDLVQVEGVWLAKGAEVMYLGAGHPVGFDIHFSFILNHPANGQAADIILSCTGYLTNRDSTQDSDTRFSLATQNIACQPSERYVTYTPSGQELDMGQFQACPP